MVAQNGSRVAHSACLFKLSNKKELKYIKRKDTLTGVPFLFMTSLNYIKASLEVLMELHYGFDTLAENLQREIFVGRMDGVAFQAESHEYCLDA